MLIAAGVVAYVLAGLVVFASVDAAAEKTKAGPMPQGAWWIIFSMWPAVLAVWFGLRIGDRVTSRTKEANDG